MSTTIVNRNRKCFSSLYDAKAWAEDRTEGELRCFSFDGERCYTYVDEDGWVLVAASLKPEPASNRILMTEKRSPVKPRSGFILPEEVLANIPDIQTIKIASEDQSVFKAESSDPLMIERLEDSHSLGQEVGDQKYWNIINGDSDSMDIIASNPGNIGLLSNVYHAKNNDNGLHWVIGFSKITWKPTPPNVYLNLWVKTDKMLVV